MHEFRVGRSWSVVTQWETSPWGGFLLLMCPLAPGCVIVAQPGLVADVFALMLCGVLRQIECFVVLSLCCVAACAFE